MRYLIDNYIIAGDTINIIDFSKVTLLDVINIIDSQIDKTNSKSKEGAAEKIGNNIRKKIVDQISVNPAYYNKMSEVLEQLIKERKQGLLEYAELLKKYVELAKKVDSMDVGDEYPESVKGSAAKRAIFDNCGKDEKLAGCIYDAVVNSMQADFRNNAVKINMIKRALSKVLKDDAEVERIYELISKQSEF